MKARLVFSLLLASLIVSAAQLLITDQSTDGYGNGAYSITTNAPIGQTFIPTLSSIGFVQLYLFDGGPATLRVNLREGGITGPILATSRPTHVPAGSQIRVHFDFGTNVPVPNVKKPICCIEPILESGEDCRFVFYHYGYLQGEGIVNGQPSTSIYSDMRFREGVVAQFAQFSTFSKKKGVIEGTLSGLRGQTLVIEWATNASNWLPLQTNVFESDTISFTDSNCTSKARFYRAFYLVP